MQNKDYQNLLKNITLLIEQASTKAYPDFEFVQPVVAQLSWSHHVLILDKFKEEKLRFMPCVM